MTLTVLGVVDYVVYAPHVTKKSSLKESIETRTSPKQHWLKIFKLAVGQSEDLSGKTSENSPADGNLDKR